MSNDADLNQHYATTGENPQNVIFRHDVDYFPKIQKLLALKSQGIDQARLHAPLHITADLKWLNLSAALGTQFETILVDPPWYEYYARSGGFPPKCEHGENMHPWTFEEIRNLRIEDIAATPSFCFIWCGNKHVEQATACLLKWGFRRIEDVCWIKTNLGSDRVPGIPDYLPYGALNVLKSTKEHLLVGIRGTVQRSRDSYLLHANIDSDVVIAEEAKDFGCMQKPAEVYDLIERFCNSQRRVELFGQHHNLRPGWVTVGGDIGLTSNYSAEEYRKMTRMENRFIQFNQEVDRLRPRSPKSAYQKTSVPPVNGSVHP